MAVFRFHTQVVLGRLCSGHQHPLQKSQGKAVKESQGTARAGAGVYFPCRYVALLKDAQPASFEILWLLTDF